MSYRRAVEGDEYDVPYEEEGDFDVPRDLEGDEDVQSAMEPNRNDADRDPGTGLFHGQLGFSQEIVVPVDQVRTAAVHLGRSYFESNQQGQKIGVSISVETLVQPDQPVDLRLLVRFGQGGFSQSFECDASSGVFLVVPAAEVDVSVDGLMLRATGVVAPRYRVGVTFTRWPYPGRHSRAQRTFFFDNVANGGTSPIVAIPPYSSDVRVGGTQFPGNNVESVTLRQFGSATGGALLCRVGSGAERAQNPEKVVPVLGPAKFFQLHNTSGAANNMSAVFMLGL